MLIQLYLQDRLVKVAVLVKQIHLKTNFFACKNGYISYIKKSAKNQVKSITQWSYLLTFC